MVPLESLMKPLSTASCLYTSAKFTIFVAEHDGRYYDDCHERRPSALAEDAVGDWIGKVKAPGGVELTIAAHIKKTTTGYEGYAESPDQTVTASPSR